MPRETRPWFPLYAGDFLASSAVRRMSTAEVGAYVLLLCESWRDDGLPNDPDELADLAGLTREEFDPMWAGRLGRCWSLDEEGVLRNKRQEVERERADEASSKRSDKAAKAARARWGRKGDAPSMPVACPGHANAMREDAPDATEHNSTGHNSTPQDIQSAPTVRNARARGGDSPPPSAPPARKPRPRKAKPWEAMLEEVPEELKPAWEDYHRYRAESKLSALTERTLRQHLAHPAPQVAAAYREAVETGWQGAQFKHFKADGSPVNGQGAVNGKPMTRSERNEAVLAKYLDDDNAKPPINVNGRLL